MGHVRRLLGAIRDWPLVPVALACAGLTATLLLTGAVRREAQARDREYLQHEANLVEQRLRARLAGYEDVLLAGAGLFASSSDVTAEEWQRFLESMRVAQRYPGFRSLGYAEVVEPGELAEFAAKLGPGPTRVYWLGDAGPGEGPAYVVRFVEPLEENRGILGLAFEGEPVRREAADLAAASGEVVMTRPIRLARDGQPGFLLFAPVYATWPPPVEHAQRLAAVRGWVYAAFAMDDFFHGGVGLLVPEIEMRVSDGTRANGEVMFDTGGERFGGPAVMTLLLGSRLVRVEVWRGAGFPAHNADLVRIVAAAGVTISVLSGVLVWILQTWRRRAEGLAARRTRELAATLALQRAIVDGAGLAIVATDRAGVVTLANPAAELLGWQVGLPLKLPGTGASTFAAMAERVEAEGMAQCEVEFGGAGGAQQVAWVAVSKLPGEGDATAGFVVIARDITAERAAQHDLDRVFAHSIDMLAVVSAKGRFQRVSPAWERTLGWKEEELLGQSLWHFVHPDDRAEQIARARAVLEGQDVHDLRGRFRQADGGWRWVSFNASAADGDASYIVARDISELVAAEEEMAEAMEVLRANAVALEEQAAELDRLRLEAEYLANHDALTGALNRRAWFHQAAIHEVSAIAVFDIDHFKQINDTYGHPAGDVVLREVAKRLEEAVGDAGMVGRIGGEEFAVFFTAPAGEAKEAALRCVGAVARAPVPVGLGVAVPVTVSGGFATWQPAPEGRPLDALAATYEAADRALYRAKEAGRHRLVA